MNAIRIHVDKVDRIFRVLLSPGQITKTWYQIAKDSSVAYGWAHLVLKRLEKNKLIHGRSILNPSELFLRWASRKDTRVYRDYHVQDPEGVLKQTTMSYALTGSFAESVVGSYLFPRRYDLYVLPADADKWNQLMITNGYVGAGNVRIMLSDEHVFFEANKIEGWPIVSPQQLIVDLIREGAECAEAAALLIGRYYQ